MLKKVEKPDQVKPSTVSHDWKIVGIIVAIIMGVFFIAALLGDNNSSQPSSSTASSTTNRDYSYSCI